MDTKVGGLMAMLKPKMGGGMTNMAKSEPDDEGGEGGSAAADAAAKAFVANPSGATFRDLMELCKSYDEGE